MNSVKIEMCEQIIGGLFRIGLAYESPVDDVEVLLCRLYKDEVKILKMVEPEYFGNLTESCQKHILKGIKRRILKNYVVEILRFALKDIKGMSDINTMDKSNLFNIDINTCIEYLVGEDFISEESGKFIANEISKLVDQTIYSKGNKKGIEINMNDFSSKEDLMKEISSKLDEVMKHKKSRLN